MKRQRSGDSGFTLVELLVAIGVFAYLGLMLVTTLASSLSAWRSGEARRSAYEKYRVVADTIRSDLENLHAPGPGEPGGLMAWPLQGGRYSLRFVMRLGPEWDNPVTEEAGEGSVADGYSAWYTGKGDLQRLKYRALGGFAEVHYFYDSRERLLYRAVRAPMGGPGSLFSVGNIDSMAKIRDGSVPVAAGILHFGMLFFGPTATTWDRSVPPGSGGPDAKWDSTLPQGPNSPGPGPLAATLPAKYRIEMIVGGGPFRTTRLAAPLKAGERALRVDSTARLPDPGSPHAFVRVGEEWLSITARSPRTLAIGTRGLFGTIERDHAAGTIVQCGWRFVVTGSLPR